MTEKISQDAPRRTRRLWMLETQGIAHLRAIDIVTVVDAAQQTDEGRDWFVGFIARLTAQGAVTAADLHTLGEPITQRIADERGIPVEMLRAEAAKGRVSGEEAVDALLYALRRISGIDDE